jgi:tetratricopeptide (TPR) repeat protein
MGEKAPGVPDVIKLQHQIRTNTADLQDFVADLGKWESEIQKKDTQLKTTGPADKEKEKGNTAFAMSNYAEAIECYSRSLELNPRNAIVFANRAMALLKINKFVEAESDCDKSIEIDKKYAKVWGARSIALILGVSHVFLVFVGVCSACDGSTGPEALCRSHSRFEDGNMEFIALHFRV